MISRSAARSMLTWLAVELCPIRPIRQTLPANSPNPAPISMLYSCSKVSRIAASSEPCRDLDGVQLRQTILRLHEELEPEAL